MVRVTSSFTQHAIMSDCLPHFDCLLFLLMPILALSAGTQWPLVYHVSVGYPHCRRRQTWVGTARLFALCILGGPVVFPDREECAQLHLGFGQEKNQANCDCLCGRCRSSCCCCVCIQVLSCGLGLCVGVAVQCDRLDVQNVEVWASVS